MAKELTVRNLQKTFGMRKTVDDVSLLVRSGQIVAFLGPNGSGKTTCFSMIAGFLTPDFGTIFLNGHNITHHSLQERARLGLRYLPQESSVFRGLSTFQNLLGVAELFFPLPDAKQRTEALLEEFRLTHVRNQKAAVLSGGERRKLEMARALIGDPMFLLLDEPWAQVDPLSTQDTICTLQRLKTERSLGVLITDHNADAALECADYVYILLNGRVFAEGTPDAIRNDPQVQKAYFGKTS